MMTKFRILCPSVALALTAVSFLGAVDIATAREAKSEALINNERPDYSALEAKVLEVIDADNLLLEVHLWPGMTVVTNVRSKGVDAPELRQPGCLREKLLAEEAKASVERKFPVGSWVYVDDVSYDKYGGRMLATIDRWISDRFQSVTEELLDKPERWGVPYHGEDKTFDWCAGQGETD